MTALWTSGGGLTHRILEDRLWGDSPFFLLDVGASGGIHEKWMMFGDRLRAIGFDPLIAEIDRLNRANQHPGVRYEAAFVGTRDYDALFAAELRSDAIATRSNDPWGRVSAIAAQQQLQDSYVQTVFNAGEPVVHADRHITLDDFVARDEYPAVDFVKIDTDGHDIEILLGAEHIIDAGGVIGISVEIQHHGAVHQYANTFDNIDRFLRSHGFTLFDLAPYRYSRTALPAPFAHDLAAQTESGQVLWSEGVYFRDLGDPKYEHKWRYIITPPRVVKLASLFELFDLRDCAAELLVNRGHFLSADAREELLDLLAGGGAGSYRARIRDFEADFRSLYPSRRKGSLEPSMAGVDSTGDGIEKDRKIRTRLKRQRQQIDKLSRRVNELKAKIKRS